MALLLLCRRLNTAEAQVLKIGLKNVTGSLYVGQNQFQQRYFQTSAGYLNVHDSLQKRNNSASATISVPTSIRAPPLSRSEEKSKSSDVRASRDEVSSADLFKEKAVWAALKVATMAYDVLTLPVYAAVQQPWKKLKEHQCTKSTLVDPVKHEWTTFLPKSKFHEELLAHNVDTMDKLFTHALTKYAPHNCLGTREVLGESEEPDATGKLVKKYELGDYSWLKYGEVDKIARNLAKTWHTLGLKPGDKLGVFAETRADWLMTAIAAFRYNMPIATVYTTLGDDGVIHALTETEVTCLVTSEELMPRCVSILKHTPRIKHLVYMDKAGSAPQYEDKFTDVTVKTLSSLIEFGESQPDVPRAPETVPKPDDPAIVMYTSGSTGVPKGVIISHYNLVSALRAATDSLDSCGDTSPDDSYIAFLPLAHSLELISESMSLIQGIKIGYSSALTLTDKSVGIKEGTKGDASLLRPTVIISVPLVLERIIKGIQTKVAENGRMAALIFDFFCKYKMNWARKGYDTPLVDRVFFKKIRDLVGGRIRVVICGGAPLAPQLHEFVRTILCAPVVQGYGLTESCGSGVLCLATDLSIGRVGGPITCTKVRLINWEEGGYRVTDKPYPRGEVYIGGDNVAMGYFKRPENTDFFVEDGVRWFKTGDIAEVHPDGGFRIIDRKKDLVKLSVGEFVSLGKIEAALKTIPLVENICVCANSFHPRPVAIVVAAQVQLLLLARRLQKTGTPEELAQEPEIKAAILKEIQRKAKDLKLENHEIPSKIHVCSEVWMPQSGLVTAAFKIKRNNVYKAYEKEIEVLFSQI